MAMSPYLIKLLFVLTLPHERCAQRMSSRDAPGTPGHHGSLVFELWPANVDLRFAYLFTLISRPLAPLITTDESFSVLVVITGRWR